MSQPESVQTVPFQDYAAVERAMKTFVDKAFLQGSFLMNLQAGRYSMPQIRYFAIQYSYYSRHFPRVLGAAISAMEPMDTWWVPLADNLWDEAGRGESGRSHQQLYLTFLRSVNPDLAMDHRGIPVVPMSGAVQSAVDTFIRFFRSCSPLQAMAAVGLGSELFAGEVMGAIGRGLEHPNYNRDGVLNTLFWSVHADEHEPRHYQLCKDVLQAYQSMDELRDLYETGAYIADSEAQMYRDLHEEMMQV